MNHTKYNSPVEPCALVLRGIVQTGAGQTGAGRCAGRTGILSLLLLQSELLECQALEAEGLGTLEVLLELALVVDHRWPLGGCARVPVEARHLQYTTPPRNYAIFIYTRRGI